MQFKPGDKIRRTEYDWLTIRVGMVVVVEKIHNKASICVVGHADTYCADCFELVEAAPQAGAVVLTPRKHAATIKAWADGAEIEVKNTFNSGWVPVPHPAWSESTEYRIKPTPKPDVVKDVYVFQHTDGSFGWNANAIKSSKNVSFTFDGDTGKLKSVQLI